MSDTDTAALTPQENAYFESKGAEPASVETKEKVDGAETPEPASKEPVAEATETLKPETEKHEKVVPLAALQEERRERQARDRELREVRDRLLNYEQRFKLVEDKLSPQAAPPDPDADPFGYTKHVGGEVDQLKQKVTQYEQQQYQQQQVNQVVAAYKADAERFSETNEGKEFSAAQSFLVAGRFSELRAMGHPNPEQALLADEFSIVTSAMQSGRSPAEVIMAVARARGFQPKVAKNGDASAKLDAIEKGQNANKSLSGAGGESPGGEMTAEALIKMSMDDFEAWTKKNPAKARRLMGGR